MTTTDNRVIATDVGPGRPEWPEADMHYLEVVLRPDQLDKIAERVVALLKAQA